jgi:hypothetical protein
VRVRLPPSPPAGPVAKSPLGQNRVFSYGLPISMPRIAIINLLLSRLTTAHNMAIIVVGKLNDPVTLVSGGATYAGIDASKISLLQGRRRMTVIL